MRQLCGSLHWGSGSRVFSNFGISSNDRNQPSRRKTHVMPVLLFGHGGSAGRRTARRSVRKESFAVLSNTSAGKLFRV